MIEVKASKEIEQEILGMLFVSKQAATKITEDCDERDFTYDIHRKMYHTAKDLIGRGKYFDLTLFCEELGWEDSAEIAEIHHFGISDAMYGHYLERLKELSMQRRLNSLRSGDIEPKHISEILEGIKNDFGINGSASDVAEIDESKVENYLSDTKNNIYDPGWHEFPNYYKLSKGQVTIVTGIPSHGKSAFIDNIAMNLVNKYQWRIMFFSPENFPVEKHVFKLIRMYTGESDYSKSGIDWVKKNFQFLSPSPDRRVLRQILNNVRDVDLFVLDPWNELESERPKDKSETEYIGEALKLIKNHAVSNDCHIIIAAHPTKMQKNDRGEYPVPKPYDINGSANWLNKADACFTVYRPVKNNKLGDTTEVHIQKIRFQPENGGLGVVEFKYRNFKFEEKLGY
ncbi:MAG: DnaB-like helicase N-terminal domain-containing protein [Promethearchaeota archaeon]|jgi:hypothetical protein